MTALASSPASAAQAHRLPRYEHYINGEEVPPAEGEYFTSDNPATGQPWYEAARGSSADVERAVGAAERTFESRSWQRLSQSQRGALLRRVGELIAENADELARTETTDNGKLLREMKAQLAGIPEYYHYYAGLADKIHGETIPASNVDVLNYTLREPVGVIGAITPWNSPLLLTTAKIAPALACGNTAVIKPSEYISASMLALAPLFEQAGFPAGAVNVVTGFGAGAGAPLVDHPDVGKLSFTGSSATGAWIAERAGKRLVRAGLELGGKSPQLVFADADLTSAANGVVAGIFAAAGQTCIAGSRVLVHRSVHDELVSRVVERASTIRIGDPADPDTELGPLATPEQQTKVENYVAAAQQEGGTLAYGGGRPDTGLDGWFHQPTVFTGLGNETRTCQEEIFGPVVAIIPFDDEDEALRIANDTSYGLAAGIWTKDLGRAHRVAAALEAGTVWVNMYRAMSPMSPRSGFKTSGLGVEHGTEVVREYTRLKSVWINTSDEPAGDPFVMRS